MTNYQSSIKEQQEILKEIEGKLVSKDEVGKCKHEKDYEPANLSYAKFCVKRLS